MDETTVKVYEATVFIDKTVFRYRFPNVYMLGASRL